MSRSRFGEVWLARDASVLPGGVLFLILSSDRYNHGTDRRIAVEVVGNLLAAGGEQVDLGPVGTAVVDMPATVSDAWFAGADAPVAVLAPDVARRAADALRRLLGP